ncbi:MAG: alpha/beta hydrolase [Patescibacteria group bacterium]
MEIEVNGVKTNYVVLGEGKPFLILHGWGSNSERWQKVGEMLSEKGLKVIIPDLPGFGKSQIPKTAWNFNNYVSWTEEFVKILNIENCYLLGHSFGGAIAVKVTVNHPQKIKKLFLVASACIRKKTASKKFLAKISKIVKIFSFLPYYLLVRKAFYKYIIRKSDYVYTEGIMKETYLKAISEDLSYYLSFIKAPTIIIWGDKDESTPLENAHFINQKIRNSKLIIIPEADHNLNKKYPEILAEKTIENL